MVRGWPRRPQKAQNSRYKNAVVPGGNPAGPGGFGIGFPIMVAAPGLAEWLASL